MVDITGNENRNTLLGSGEGDTLSGEGDNDIIFGYAGNDVIYGDYRPGNTGSFPGSDILTGGTGNDVIYGQEANDYIDGGPDDDFLFGGSDNFALTSDFPDNRFGYNFTWLGDLVSYQDAAAAVKVSLALQFTFQDTKGAGEDYLEGFEALLGSEFNDVLVGDNGDNYILSGGGNDRIKGAGGNDHITVMNVGTVIIYGGGGIDSIELIFPKPAPGNSQAAGILSAQPGLNLDLGAGTASWDGGGATVTGIENADGSEFDDTLRGSSGANRFESGAGSDGLYGDEGNDALLGGDGNDSLFGGDGADELDGGLGDDLLNGGKGRDTAVYTSTLGQAGQTVDLSLGTSSGTAGTDTLKGIENLKGGLGNDVFTGNGAANVLDGGNSADILNGGGGNDTLIGPGELTGGAGNDRFVFQNGRLGHILDLEAGDVIDLSAIDADTTLSGDQAFVLVTEFPGDDAHGVAMLYSPEGLGQTFLYLWIDGIAANRDEGAIIIDGVHTDFANIVL